MCTSFIKTTEDNCYIAMNFDNNGMKYSINARKKGWFIIYVHTDNGKWPSFGVHESGIFFNNLMVDTCEKGKYRRCKGVVHTSRFLNEIIDEKIQTDALEAYLETFNIVNVPNYSTHNMICGTQNAVWMIEPGRGNLHAVLKANEFKVMTNFSLIDIMQSKEGITCERYRKTSERLSEYVPMSVKRAFEILDEVKQSEGEWITTFSMVFDKANKTIYYCRNQNFTCIEEYLF